MVKMITKKLHSVLEEIQAAISQLLEISKSKQEVLINRDHDNLNALTNQEQRLLAEINELSRQQRVVTAEFKAEYQVPNKIDSITEILEIIDERIDPRIKQSIIEILENIKTNSEELSEINDQNKVLIDTSREFIKGIIHAVRGSSNNSIINRKM